MHLAKISFFAGFVVLFSAMGVHADDAASHLPPTVYGYPIGQSVEVLNVTAPEEAKKMGFEYLELALQNLLPLSDVDFSNQVQRISYIGIPAHSGYGFLPADLQVVGNNVDNAHLDDVVRRSLGRVRKLRLKMVVYGKDLAGTRKVPEGFSREVARKQFLEFMQRAAIEAQNRGMTILIEPMPPESADLINTVAEGLEFVEGDGRPNVQLLVDYTSFVQSKEDREVLKRAAPRIGQVEIQNPNGRVYPASADESDYASFFRALKEGGYRGGFSVSGKPGDAVVDGPRAITVLRTLAATFEEDDKSKP